MVDNGAVDTTRTWTHPYATAARSHGRWNFLWILFSFNGRIDRTQFWAATGLILTGLCITTLGFAAATNNRYGLADSFAYTVILLLPAILWTGLARTAKRFHDRNKSGWWALVGFIPYIGPVWIIAECGGMPGTYGENWYDHNVSLDGRAFVESLVRFVPEIVMLLLYLGGSLFLVMIGVIGLAGIYEATAATVAAIAIGMLIVIYGLPLALFGYSVWLHFKKRQYRRALLVMTPAAIVGAALILFPQF